MAVVTNAKEERIKSLEESLRKVKARIRQVEDRRRQEKGNEDAWVGHGGPGYWEDENEYQVLQEYLGEIEAELRKLKSK